MLVEALGPELTVEPQADEAKLSMNALSVGLPRRLKSSVTFRVYSEVSDAPLSAHVARKVAVMIEQAGRL